ncbi:MAG: redoxin domain-containing protein [Pyrinomonadaceae bacterium]
MRRQNIIAVGLLVVSVFVGVVVGVSGLTKNWGPLSSDSDLAASPATLRSDGLVAAGEFPTAPDFGSGMWINSEPLTLKGLRGKVVLVEFWTFGCYNCRNTLPFVKRWHERYSNKGLTIVGVHSPEFDSEKKIENVRRQVASLGIRFPVVTDNEHETWRAYKVEAWPTIFVLDKSGLARWKHVGEGRYEETEQVIQRLLNEDTESLNK